MNRQIETGPAGPLTKFADPDWTAKGEPRAKVSLSALRTLWFNTGTLCNITCANCYIHSSPTNDALAYLSAAEVERFLDEAKALGEPLEEVGFTGGEPFMNPEILAMIEAALTRGHRVLVLTNAMRPMMRPRLRAGLARLAGAHGDRLVLRVSLDHYTAALHDEERGAGSFEITVKGLRWLRDTGIRTAIAGRTVWGEPEAEARDGYARLIAAEGLQIDAGDPGQCVLFPEMDVAAEVPEITTACWSILRKDPGAVMCASARMVVRHRGAARASVLACTLIADDPRFELAPSLAGSRGEVALNHPHCAKFCVLGGASCSG
jgi:uncharacterized Fe-S cluster-containing radical SAM superfamily protein